MAEGKNKTKKKKNKLVIVLLVILGLIAALTVYNIFFMDKTIHVTGTKATTGEINQYVSLTGTVESSNERSVFAPAQVSVTKLHIKEGDVVEQGALIAEFDPEDLQTAYQQASLQHASAKLAYEDAVNSNEENKKKVITKEDQILRTESDIDGLDSAMDAIKISKLQGDLSMYKSEKSQANASIISDEKLGQLKNSMDITALSLASTKKALDEGKAGLTAEIGGVVTKLAMVEGGMTSAASPCLVIRDISSPVVKFSLGKYDINTVRAEQEATITLAGHAYAAKVSHIDAVTSIEGTSIVVKAEASFDELPEKVVLGLEADISILVASKSNIMVLPFEAIRTDRDGSYCLTVKDGIAQKNYLELGVGSETHSEIISGLAPGDVVILTAPSLLAPGMPVTVDSVA